MTELPTGWRRLPLAELGNWFGGGTPSKGRTDFWENGTVPWLSPKDMGPEVIQSTQDHITDAAVVGSSVRRVPGGSVALVVRSGILERTLPIAVVPFEVTLNQDMKALVPRLDLDARWVAWGLRSLEQELLRGCRKSGTTVASIETKSLMAQELPVPPLDQQRRIVEILEDHLSRLDAAERLLDDCQRRGKPLMRRLLIDACLGRGLGDSDRPTASVSDVEWGGATPPRVSLPPGWRWQKWRDVGSSQNGRAFPSADYQASGLRLLRPGNLGLDGRLDWRPAATKCLPEIYRGSHADLLLRSGDLVMNLTAQSLKDDFLGRVCLVRETDEALLNQRLARLVPSAFSSAFAMIVFRSPLFRAHVSSLNAGSLIQHMFTKQIAEFWVPVPTPEDENRVVKRFGDQAGVGERLAMLDAQAARVQGLRRSLLSAAFSGRLTGEVVDHGGVEESARV